MAPGAMILLPNPADIVRYLLKPLPMSSPTPHFFTTAYRTPALAPQNPILQILAFEGNPATTPPSIIVRLSDGYTFVDCNLVGAYAVGEGVIVEDRESGEGREGEWGEYRVYDLVKLQEYRLERNEQWVAKLRVSVASLRGEERVGCRYGHPGEFGQHVDSQQVGCYELAQAGTAPVEAEFTAIKQEPHPITTPTLKIQQPSLPSPSLPIPLPSKASQIRNLVYQPSDPRTKSQLLSGQQGYYVGKLIRLKMTSKQTRQGSMSVLVMSFMDYSGQLMRISMAGRIAIKEYKQLKRKKCYYMRGLEAYQSEKMYTPQIRIKEKQFKIKEINNSKIYDIFNIDYHNWDHELSSIQSQKVDVVGVVDEIQDKMQYLNTANNQKRQAVRIVVRNVYKTVKISFWAEQINSFRESKVMRREAIVLEDLRKKKNRFLDFTNESTIIRLDQDPELKKQLQYLIPPPSSPQPPRRIAQLSEYFQLQPAKIAKLPLYLLHIDPQKITYRICTNCRRKSQPHNPCPFCQCTTFDYKYNCEIQFADYTGSVTCIAFDNVASGVLGMGASQMGGLERGQVEQVVMGVRYGLYEVEIENKNLRRIVRSVREMEAGQGVPGVLADIRHFMEERDHS